MITGGAQGRASGAGGEEMEDREEMEAESTSNVPMLAAGGNFIAGTADTTVTQKSCVVLLPEIRFQEPQECRRQSQAFAASPLHDLSDGHDATCALYSEIGQR